MNIIRYNPNPWFDTVFDRLTTDFISSLPVASPKSEGRTLVPRVDIREIGDTIVLTAEIPGVDRDGLKIEVKNGVLTLQGEKHREKSKEQNGYYRSERAYGSFYRSFSVPDDVDGDAIEASYKDGVLTLSLPKKPEAAAKVIAITEGGGNAKPKEVGVN